MKSSKIKSLIKLVEDSSIGELEVSSWGGKVIIRKKAGSNHDNSHGQASPIMAPQPIMQQTRLEVATQTAQSQTAHSELIEIKSPMVGTYYRAPAPDAKPYVEVGQTIKKGQVVCIVEAMKLMNEIEAEMPGRVVEILVENAKPIQFGQPLFLIEPL